MRVEFIEDFKLVLIAETELERLFMLEWDIRANSDITDSNDRDLRVMDPSYVTWKAEK